MKHLSGMPGNKYITGLKGVYFSDDEESEKCCLIVMEYAEGRCLKTFIQRAAKSKICLTSQMIHTLCFNLFSALNFLHQANVVHRDIKPANIIVSEDLDVKICDFGLARTLPRDGQGI